MMIRTISRPSAACLLLLSWISFGIQASDHADPILLKDSEAGITDLFAFENPTHHSLVIVLCTYRGLAQLPPLELRPLSFTISIDCRSHVSFDDEDFNARYGGRVAHPDRIEPTVTLSYRLNDNVTLAERTLTGFGDKVRLPDPFVGIRDDPFIFYRFNNSNVVAIVQEIPYQELPKPELASSTNRTFLIWATSDRFGKRVDHVGRSLRTMLPRMDFLNTLPPSQHARELQQRHTDPGVLQNVLATYASPYFAIRHYDFAPDVMIFSRDRPAGYPNGRLLEDDVAELCCRQGDCLLYEVSLAEANADHRERPRVNNVPFLAAFPYLAAPNESPTSPPPAQLRLRTIAFLALVALLVISFVLLPWYLLYRTRGELSRTRKLNPINDL